MHLVDKENAAFGGAGPGRADDLLNSVCIQEVLIPVFQFVFIIAPLIFHYLPVFKSADRVDRFPFEYEVVLYDLGTDLVFE